ncbi:MAG: DUF2848 domain-containing protein [Firmicutes bacterium]|nr:DUF2848 domain-containing protein [Bacillota bacterium]
MGKKLEFNLDGQKIAVCIDKQLLAGRTSRDIEEVKKHLEELRKTGVQLSDEAPIFHAKISDRITTETVLEYVPGRKSSGEVEFVLLTDEKEQIYVGVCSDHTDRDLQTYNTNLAKQVFDTPISPELWRYEDVIEHWDELVMRAWVIEDGKPVLYQEGKLEEMLRPEEILEKAREKAVGGDIKNALITGGTFPTLSGDLNYSNEFVFELYDPIKEKRIKHQYKIEPIKWIKK